MKKYRKPNTCNLSMDNPALVGTYIAVIHALFLFLLFIFSFFL